MAEIETERQALIKGLSLVFKALANADSIHLKSLEFNGEGPPLPFLDIKVEFRVIPKK